MNFDCGFGDWSCLLVQTLLIFGLSSLVAFIVWHFFNKKYKKKKENVK